MEERLASLGLLLLVVAAGIWADGNDDYEQMFLDVDIDSILNNDRILDSYVHCFLNTGHCSERAEKAKLMLFLATIILGGFLASVARADDDQEDLYKKIFDDVDVDSILNNDRILDTYLKCFFNTGPCSNLAQTMKGKIPEVFETVCGMCTEKQKDIFKHCLDVFIPKRPDDWKHILEIYDPDGKYWPGIKAFLETPRRR